MAEAVQTQARGFFLDKREIQKIIAEQIERLSRPLERMSTLVPFPDERL